MRIKRKNYTLEEKIKILKTHLVNERPQLGKRDPNWHSRFTQAQANVSQKRRRSKARLKEGQNLRAAVEATVRQVKYPFPAGKVPVRGQFRVTCMLIGSAVMRKIRRIQR